MATEMERVELHNSFVWDCSSCGSENWQRSVTTFLDKNNPDDAATLHALYGDELIDDESVLFRSRTFPQMVVCHECKETFKAISPDLNISDDDDGE